MRHLLTVRHTKKGCVTLYPAEKVEFRSTGGEKYEGVNIWVSERLCVLLSEKDGGEVQVLNEQGRVIEAFELEPRVVGESDAGCRFEGLGDDCIPAEDEKAVRAKLAESEARHAVLSR